MLALTISIFLDRSNWKFCRVYKSYLLNSTGFNSLDSRDTGIFCEMTTNMAPVDEQLSINCNFFGYMPNWATYHLLRAFYLQISCKI